MTAEDFAAMVAPPGAGYIEVRRATATGMRSEYVATPAEAAAALSRGSEQRDTYIGMAPRARQSGSSDAVEQAWVISADCDDDASITALEGFEPRPTAVIASGSRTASGRPKVHAHWALTEAIDRTALETAKRQLARALGSDGAIVDAARIMRAPGTFNHKSAPATPVLAVEWAPEHRYTVAEVVGHLPEAESVARPEQVELTPEVLAAFKANAEALPAAERAELEREAQRHLDWARTDLEALPLDEGNDRGTKFYAKACKLGEYIAAGVLDMADTRGVLVAAAERLGLPEDHQAWRSIERGLCRGASASKVTVGELDDFGPSGKAPTAPPRDEDATTPPAEPAEKPVADRYAGRVTDLAALLAEADEPVSWRCEGFVADGTLTMLCGRGGSGKTWLGAGLAFGVARGQTVAGITCTQGRAGIVDFEMGRQLYRGRMHAAGLTVAEHEIVYIDANGLDLNRPDDLAFLLEQVHKHELNYVLWDSLRRATPTLKENESDDMARVVAALATGARETGAAFDLIHHQGADRDKWFRGSTAILDQVDALFGLVPEANPEDDQDEELRRLSCRGQWGKLRYAERPHDLYMRLDVAQGGMVAGHRPMPSKRSAYEAQIRSLLPAKTKTEVAKACETSTNNSTWEAAWGAVAAPEKTNGMWHVMPDIGVTAPEPSV